MNDNTIKIYDKHVELHSNHTIWKIKNFITWQQYDLLLSEQIRKFKQITNIDIEMLGRSGRHICVKDTQHNRQQFINLRRCAIKLENELVDFLNMGNDHENQVGTIRTQDS